MRPSFRFLRQPREASARNRASVLPATNAHGAIRPEDTLEFATDDRCLRLLAIMREQLA